MFPTQFTFASNILKPAPMPASSSLLDYCVRGLGWERLDEAQSFLHAK